MSPLFGATSLSPQVTVVLPHFRCESYLAEAVASILSQTYTAFRLVIVDDSSPTDDWLRALSPVLHDRRIRVCQTSRTVGPYRIANRLLPSIETPFVAFQDADDVSHPTRFECQLSLMHREHADIVGCAFTCIDERGRILPAWRTPGLWLLRRALASDRLAHHPTTLLKREIALALGGFDGTTRFGADTDFMRRAQYIARIRNCREALYFYRQRRQSLTGSDETGTRSDARREYKRRLRLRGQLWKKAPNEQTRLKLLQAEPNDVSFELGTVWERPC